MGIAMTKALKHMGLLENMSQISADGRPVVLLDCKPINGRSPEELRKVLRATKCVYYIVYNPTLYDREQAHFSLICDMLAFPIWFYDVRGFFAAAHGIPEVKFLLEYTNFDPMIIVMAKAHPGIRFPFSLNIQKYVKALDKNTEKAGIPKEERKCPFFVSKYKIESDMKIFTPGIEEYKEFFAQYELEESRRYKASVSSLAGGSINKPQAKLNTKGNV